MSKQNRSPLVAAAALLLAAGAATGQNRTVGDEVGADHIAFVFAPYIWAAPAGEDAYRNHVSRGAGNVGQQYGYIAYMETTQPNIAPSTCTVARFHTLIRNETDYLGTLLITTHGSGTGLSIQPYRKNPAGLAARDAAFDALLQANGGPYAADELYKSNNEDAYAIGVTGTFIRNYGRLTQGLVWIAACNGGGNAADFVAANARVALGNSACFTPEQDAARVNTFFRRMDGQEGQARRPVSKARTGIASLTISGNRATTLAPSVIRVDAPCPIKAGDIVTYTLDTECEMGIVPNIVGIGCTIEHEVWINKTTLQGTCTRPPSPGVFFYALRLVWDRTYSDANVARLDGNTIPAVNARGRAHDDYVSTYSCLPPNLPFTDGRFDSGYRTEDRVAQETPTGFGDNLDPDPRRADGSEIDSVSWALIPSGDMLRVHIAGNLETNFNKLELFLDVRPGGQNRILGNNPDVDFGALQRMGDDGTGNGLTFDEGFAADYYLTYTAGPTDFTDIAHFFSVADLLSNGGGAGRQVAGGPLMPGQPLTGPGLRGRSIQVALDNSNIGGVTEESAHEAALVLTGFELAIPLSEIGWDGVSPIRLCAFINGRQHDFVSNQVSGSLWRPDGTPFHENLGDPRFVNFELIEGVQNLTLFETLPEEPCPADFNGDGQVDFFDYLDFVMAYNEEDPAADFNGDGQVDFFDYLDFVEAFSAGCE